jgi:transcription-repair coupling factor (superfamily II helicase)
MLELKRGGRLDQGKLVEYLVGKGYTRSGTVGEAGEFAVRGGIVDLFPPGTSMPIRVDFFGDEIEDLRLFDPLSQRSLGKLDAFALRPINELQLTPDAIEHFRTNYRSEFGTSGADDPLYEAISAGRQFPGMEHWLPLFGTQLVPFESYLPRAIVTLDHQVDEAVKARLEMIQDFYQARRDLQAAERESGAPVLSAAGGRQALHRRECLEGVHREARCVGVASVRRAGRGRLAQRSRPLRQELRRGARQPRREPVPGRRRLRAQRAAARPACAADRRLDRRARAPGSPAERARASSSKETVESWEAFGALPAGTMGRAVLSLDNGFQTDAWWC